METTQLSVINKYLSNLQKDTINCSSFGLIFRGQSNSEWELVSSAYRRISNDKENLEYQKTKKISNSTFLRYNQKLIVRAREYGYGKGLEDLELLAEIQHFGGATCLLDFTSNFLVALWFASSDPSTDGAIHIINTDSDIKSTNNTNKLYFNEIKNINKEFSEIINHFPSHINRELKLIHTWKPSKIINRIYHQDSVFIFGYPLFEEITLSVITIEKADKIDIRRELKKFFKVDTETIFGDLQGFSLNANNFNLPIDDSFYLSCEELIKRSMNNNDYETALEYFKNIHKCKKDRDYCIQKNEKCRFKIQSEKKVDEFEFSEILCRIKMSYKEIEKDINYSIESILDVLDKTSLKKGIINLYDILANYYYDFKVYDKIVNIYERALLKDYSSCKLFEASLIELSIVTNNRNIYKKHIENISKSMNSEQNTYNGIIYRFFFTIGKSYFENENNNEYMNDISNMKIPLKSARWDFNLITEWRNNPNKSTTINSNNLDFIYQTIDKMIDYQIKNL